MATKLEMFGYWRSQATYRLRVVGVSHYIPQIPADNFQAMNMKGISYQEKPVDLDGGEQFSEEFRKVNPLGSVPAVMVDGKDGKEPLTVSEPEDDRTGGIEKDPSHVKKLSLLSS